MNPAEMTPRDRLIHNERVKLTAGFLVNVGVMASFFGLIGLVFMWLRSDYPSGLSIYCCGSIVIGMLVAHLGTRWVKRLI